MTLKVRILICLRRLFIILVSLTMTSFSEKCLFPLDAYMVSCPTWSKNLGQILLLTPVKSNIYTKCHGNGTSRVEECRFIVLHVCSCTLLECEKNHQKFLGSMVPFRWEKQHHAWLSIQFTIDKRGCSPLYLFFSGLLFRSLCSIVKKR